MEEEVAAGCPPAAKRPRQQQEEETAAGERRRSPRGHVRGGVSRRGLVERFFLTDEERRAIRRLQREEAAEKKRKAALEAEASASKAVEVSEKALRPRVERQPRQERRERSQRRSQLSMTLRARRSKALERSARRKEAANGEEGICYFFRLPRRYVAPPTATAPLPAPPTVPVKAAPAVGPSQEWLEHTARRLLLTRQQLRASNGLGGLRGLPRCRWLYVRPARKSANPATFTATPSCSFSPARALPPPPGAVGRRRKADSLEAAGPCPVRLRCAKNVHALVDRLCASANPFLHSWERASWLARSAFLAGERVGPSGARMMVRRRRLAAEKEEEEEEGGGGGPGEVFMLW